MLAPHQRVTPLPVHRTTRATPRQDYKTVDVILPEVGEWRVSHFRNLFLASRCLAW